MKRGKVCLFAAHGKEIACCTFDQVALCGKEISVVLPCCRLKRVSCMLDGLLQVDGVGLTVRVDEI